MPAQESPFHGVPPLIVDLATNLTDFVEKAIGLRPDFSPETLSLVDHYAVQAKKAMESRPELQDLTGQALGAYFGEVVRRSEGAFWLLPTPNYHDWQLCGLSAFVTINPIGVGYDALFGSAEHGGPSSAFKLAPEDREPIAERLGRLPQVADSEYFTLCTRFEVLQIVMDAVRAQQSRRGYDDMTFAAEDYGGELKPLGDS